MTPTDLPEPAAVEPRGYIAATVGCVLGAGAGLALGAFAGIQYAERFMPDGGLEALGPLVVGEVAGVWVGSGAGAFAGLKAAGRRAAAPTGWLVLAAIATWAVVSMPSFFWLIQRLSGDDIPDVLEIVVPVLILCIPPPLAARWLVLHNEKVRAARSKREEISM